MTIHIKCPVCNAGNELTPAQQQCRRCGEDLSLLYRVKGFSFKYRLYLLQNLAHRATPQFRRLAHTAAWLVKPGNG